jgi:hypothetical protein
MRRRAIHWLVLGFAALWFNVVLPVHKRGQITLGGPPEGGSHACCKTAQPGSAPSSKNHCPVPGSRPSGPCAVCFFMAGLCTPPPVTVVERRLGYAGQNRIAARSAPEVARFCLPLNSRAPPLV